MIEPRDELRVLSAGVHGAIDHAELAELGIRPEDVLDFSANVNPFGPAPAVRAAAAAAVLDEYPDRDAIALRTALATALGIPAAEILVGNGATELIWLVGLAFLRPGDRVLVLEPTFCEYARVARMMGAELVSCRAGEEEGFIHPPDRVRDLLADAPPRVVFLANPNNPTGGVLDSAVIEGWARCFPQTLFVVDEAYRSFVEGQRGYPTHAALPNVLILRSMTKDFALAGLRLGYALGPEPLLKPLASVRPPWSVNAVAQAAGIAALMDPAFLDESLRRLDEAKAELVEGIVRLGIPVVPSAVHYFLARVGDASGFRRALLARGMLVRDAASFGLPEYVRIAARCPEDNRRLLEAIAAIHGGALPEDSPARLPRSTSSASPQPRAKLLMIQGTSSSVGKSLLVTALCRIYARRGVRVAPFKAQNMSNNAAVCGDGAEIGRAQALQARAAGIAPTADMNPILLKPEADSRSQVIVLGRPWQTLPAGAFYRRKEEFWPIVTAALDRMHVAHDLIIIEGAGSPVELNLRSTDLVNMALARHAGCPVLLAGDIDRGGIFPQLLGTLMLLDPEERGLVRGLIVNKFRGDPSLFTEGVRILQQHSGVPVLGVVPYLRELGLPEEDAVALGERRGVSPTCPDRADDARTTDIAVIHLPHIANFDDFDPLQRTTNVHVRYVHSVAELGRPHAIILPGTKSTIADLSWLRSQGLADAIRSHAAEGTQIVGVCGGYQMLGRSIQDPESVESTVPQIEGLGLLDTETVFASAKATHQVRARIRPGPAWLVSLVGQEIEGYEIHMGRTPSAAPWLEILAQSNEPVSHADGTMSTDGRIWGCYLHGLFANDAFRRAWLASLGHVGEVDRAEDAIDAALDRLADAMESAIDMKRVDAIIRGESGA